jgi:hypothetical protein
MTATGTHSTTAASSTTSAAPAARIVGLTPGRHQPAVLVPGLGAAGVHEVGAWGLLLIELVVALEGCVQLKLQLPAGQSAGGFHSHDHDFLPLLHVLMRAALIR